MSNVDQQNGINLGRYTAFWFQNSPRRALHYLSYYKWAAKMIGADKAVLDVGCSEGLGTWLLKQSCGRARGLDLDQEAIDVAKSNWTDDGIQFDCGDVLQEAPVPEWDAVTNFDVIEHIRPENAATFIEKIAGFLKPDGVAIIGTPSLESQVYASPHTKAGHINCYTAERLEEELREFFEYVFIFSANDEMVHTGFPRMAHYLLALCCGRK